jgi:hypothetical protein
MAFNLPTYTGGQLAHLTTLSRCYFRQSHGSDAIVYTSDIIKCYCKLTQSHRRSTLFKFPINCYYLLGYGDTTNSDVTSASNFIYVSDGKQ